MTCPLHGPDCKLLTCPYSLSGGEPQACLDGLAPDNGERYARSIREIEKTFDNPERALKTLLPRCEEALQYDWSAPRRRWDDDQAARDDAAHAGHSAREVAEYLTRYKSKLGFTVAAAVNSNGMRFEPGCDVIATLAAVLNDIGGGLTNAPPAIAAKGGPFLHRVRYGPLIYPTPIEDRASGKLPSPHTAHLLYMVFWNRRLTQRSPGPLFMGMPMPEEGEPKYEVAAALADDTFGGANTADGARNKVKNILKRTPGLTFYRY